jgi:pyridoxine 5-phosphate synthase
MCEITKLGVNVDHVATLRQARQEGFPSVVDAALAAIKGGAAGITAHLRQDRRHIQDQDLFDLKQALPVPLNMEMAATSEIVGVAEKVKPAWCCLVPENREELTTEGGLSVAQNESSLASAVERLKKIGARVSFFIEPDLEAVRIVKKLGGDAVELHTGAYANIFSTGDTARIDQELNRIKEAAMEAGHLGLIINAGHGINYKNVGRLTRVTGFYEFNIGFSIVARSVFVGMEHAVYEMKTAMRN